jgi:hypothetical protein
MDAPQRGALMFVRLVAGCVMVIGLLDAGLYLTKCLMSKPPLPINIMPILLNLIPFVIGIAIFIKSKDIADWIADKLE